MIAAKYKDVPIKKTKGKYRKIMKIYWGDFERLYNKRSIVETGFSVIKKRGGDKITAKSLHMRNKQVLLKLIAYNTSRFCDLVRSNKFPGIVMPTTS